MCQNPIWSMHSRQTHRWTIGWASFTISSCIRMTWTRCPNWLQSLWSSRPIWIRCHCWKKHSSLVHMRRRQKVCRKMHYHWPDCCRWHHRIRRNRFKRKSIIYRMAFHTKRCTVRQWCCCRHNNDYRRSKLICGRNCGRNWTRTVRNSHDSHRKWSPKSYCTHWPVTSRKHCPDAQRQWHRVLVWCRQWISSITVHGGRPWIMCCHFLRLKRAPPLNRSMSFQWWVFASIETHFFYFGLIVYRSFAEFAWIECLFGETYGQTKYRISLAERREHRSGTESCEYCCITICCRTIGIVTCPVCICVSGGRCWCSTSPMSWLDTDVGSRCTIWRRKRRKLIISLSIPQWHIASQSAEAFIQYFGTIL